MTEKKLFDDLLAKADGDPYEALRLAVKCIGMSGLMISAGYARDCPYDYLKLPEQNPEPLDA